MRKINMLFIVNCLSMNSINNIKKLPKIHKHELSLMCEGIGSNNPKEYCKCVDCKKLRERRNLIYNKPIHKIKRWFNNNF